MSADRLVVALWGESPPPSAVSALRAYASRLRGALGAGQRLRFQAPGYVLSLDGALDAADFERASARRARAAAADDHAAALTGSTPRWPVARRRPRRVRPTSSSPRPSPRGSTSCARARSRSGPKRCCGSAAPRTASRNWRRSSSATPPGTPAALLMHALYGSGRPPTRWRSTRRCAATSPTSWASIRPTPTAPTGRCWRRTRRPHHRPRPAPGTCRGRHRAGGPGRRRSAGARTRCGPPRWSRSPASAGSASPASRSRSPAASATGSPTAPGCRARPARRRRPVGHAVAAALGVQQRHGCYDRADALEYLAARRCCSCSTTASTCWTPPRGWCRARRHCPGRRRARHEPGTARVDGEQLWPVPPLPLAGRLGALRAAGAGHPARLPPRPEPTRRRRDLRAARRAAAGHRAGRGPDAGDERRRDRRAARRRPPARRAAPRTAQPRHQSLAAAIDWSFRLLPEPEQRAVRADVGVRGRRRPRGRARGVRRARHATDDAAVDLLAALVDKSMVVAVEQAGRHPLPDAGDPAGLRRGTPRR